jgi:prolyl 4-hydroxylase
LTHVECARILEELEFTLWRPSLTYAKQHSGAYENQLTEFRVSETAYQRWFNDELRELMSDIEGRLERLILATRDHLEEWQATRYAPGGHLAYHLDSGYWSDHWAAERVLTCVLYLDTATAGGGTDFRALDMHVEARAGRLLAWQNLLRTGGADHRMIHASMPLLEGKKTTLVTWQRQKKARPPF